MSGEHVADLHGNPALVDGNGLGLGNSPFTVTPAAKRF